jgi:hypothetical protein
MKRVFKTVCLIAMVGLLAVSCKKKEEESAKFTMNFGETSGFQAGPSFDGSKAYFDPTDGYKFKWNAGDEVVIYNLASDYTQSNSEIFTAATDGARVVFEGNPIGSRKDIGYFVFYNADKAHRDLKELNTETFEVKRTQTYDPTCYADPTALVAACTTEESADGHASAFTVNHIFGYLNVAIGGFNTGITVDSIVVTDNKWNLTGQLDLRLPEVNASQFNTLLNMLENGNDEDAYVSALNTYLHQLGYNAHGNQSKSIKLDCKGVAVPYHAWKYFFISLRPGALYKGFSVDVYLTGNGDNNHLHIDVDANKNWLIKPAYFRNLYVGTDGHTY